MVSISRSLSTTILGLSNSYLSHHSQEYEWKDGENNWENKRKVPVSGLQEQFTVDHNDYGLSKGHLQGPEICFIPSPGEILDKEGHQGVPQSKGGPPK